MAATIDLEKKVHAGIDGLRDELIKVASTWATWTPLCRRRRGRRPRGRQWAFPSTTKSGPPTTSTRGWTATASSQEAGVAGATQRTGHT